MLEPIAMAKAVRFFRRCVGTFAWASSALLASSAQAEPNVSTTSDGATPATATTQAAAPTASPTSPMAPSTTRELRYNLPVDVSVTVAAAAGFLFAKLDTNNLTPAGCSWCDFRSDGSDSLSGFDASIRNALVKSDTTPAASANDVVAYGVAPVAALGLLAFASYRDEGNLHHAPIDMMLVAEATFLSLDVNEIVRFAIPREIPGFHFASADVRAAGSSAETRLSFYSEHTSTAFALAVSAGTIAEMRGYSIAPLVWGSGLIIATTTGYLGIASDKNYASDVLIGAAAGSLIGFGVPYMFHHPLARRVRFSFSPEKNGGSLGAGGVW